MVRFYRDILGFHTDWNGGDFAEFKTASGETFEIALWQPCFADVDAEYERLSKLDVQFPTGEPKTFFV